MINFNYENIYILINNYCTSKEVLKLSRNYLFCVFSSAAKQDGASGDFQLID